MNAVWALSSKKWKLRSRKSSHYKGKFDPTVFWANAAIMFRFPLNAAVARSYLSAMLHEAMWSELFRTLGVF